MTTETTKPQAAKAAALAYLETNPDVPAVVATPDGHLFFPHASQSAKDHIRRHKLEGSIQYFSQKDLAAGGAENLQPGSDEDELAKAEAEAAAAAEAEEQALAAKAAADKKAADAKAAADKKAADAKIKADAAAKKAADAQAEAAKAAEAAKLAEGGANPTEQPSN